MSALTDEGSESLSEVLPLTQLISYLHDAIRNNEFDNQILISDDIVQAISQLPLPISSADLPELVSIFDGENNKTLSMLDDRSLVCIAHVLLNAELSLAQERGLFLLLVLSLSLLLIQCLSRIS
ncbi:hypothetical protein M432DRAFT_155789 [Thermoascus aurantiacus ATCC 26904]